jgi:hypothetical protein
MLMQTVSAICVGNFVTWLLFYFEAGNPLQDSGRRRKEKQTNDK